MAGGNLHHVFALTVYNGELIAGGEFITAGGHASAYWARWGPACPLGDMDCNSMIELADIVPFVSALLDPSGLDFCEQFTADVDANGAIDGLDIQVFVDAISGG